MVQSPTDKPETHISSCSKATFIVVVRYSWTDGLIRRIRTRRGTGIRYSDVGKATPSSSKRSDNNDKFWFDFDGHPHTTQLHTIERFTRTDLNTLSWDVTIIDPGAYQKPFTVRRRRGSSLLGIMEYICQENNTNVSHIQGPQEPRDSGRARHAVPDQFFDSRRQSIRAGLGAAASVAGNRLTIGAPRRACSNILSSPMASSSTAGALFDQR